MTAALVPSEHLVALVDMPPLGRALSIGSQVNGDVLQWFDGERLHLVRGRMLPDQGRRHSFEFERAADGIVMKFVELTSQAFEQRFRESFPDAPHGLGRLELADWLRSAHGLWK